MKEKLSGVYIIQNTVNKKIYIGSSVDIDNRISSHKSKLRRNLHYNKHLQLDFNIYSENKFNFFLFKQIEGRFNLQQQESYLIKRTPVHYLYNIRLDFTFGYNSEYRERYSIPIYVYKEDVWEYYNSIAKASRCLNIQETHIVRCLKGKGSTNKGYYFFYKKPSDLSFTNARRGGKKVSINGKIFNSIKEASLHLNMLERSLRKAIQQQTRFIVDNNIKYIY